MKHQLFISIFFLFIGTTVVKAQEPDFKFHLAFEDATGAKDTIWLIWDSLATSGYDPQFEDTPQSLPTGNFRTYIKYNGVDSGKVKALDYTYDGINFSIFAQDYVHPINMYWDTVLIFNNNLPFEIREAYFDNEYIFLVNNWNPYHIFNALWDNHLELPDFPWGSQQHFPIYFYMGYHIFVDVPENIISKKELRVFPNPVSTYLNIRTEEEINDYQITVKDVGGRLVLTESITTANCKIDVSGLSNGVYFIELQNKTHRVVQKFIKH